MKVKKIILAVILAFSLSGLIAETASAQFLAQPFGGKIVYKFFCPCSASWILYIGGASNLALDYVPFSQGFLNYNLPFAGNILGKYRRTSLPVCKIYVGTGCSTVPTNGVVTSTVGSSGLGF